MVNITNSSEVLLNMPIKPETFIIVIAACFVLSIAIGIGFLLWSKIK